MSVVLRYPNLADDPAVQKVCREELAPLLIRTRRERQLLTQQWLRYDNLGKSRHDSDAYHGRLRAYLSTGRRVIDNWVMKLKTDVFPDSGKWFEIHPETHDSEDGVPTLDALFRRYLWEYMRIRRKATPVLRTLVTLGTAPIDIGWRYATRKVPTLQKVWDDAKGNRGRAEAVLKDIVEYIGPTLRPVDLFRFYVYPTSVNDVGDLTVCFEDTLLAEADIRRLGQTWISEDDHDLGHHFENTAAALQLLQAQGTRDTLEKFNAERVRLAARGLHSPVDTPDDPNRLLSSVKCYWRTDRIAAQDDPDGEDGQPPWYQIVFAGDNDVLQVRRVTFWSGQPSYLVPKFVEVWNEFYGYGLPGTFDSLHYMMNDVLNQGGDALTFSLNPIVGVDPGAVQDMTTIRMRPGAKWLVRRPRENMMFTEPPKDAAMAAMQTVQNLIALINDVGNVAPFSGTSAGKARGRAINTVGGMQMVASENLVQVHDVIQGIEDLWLNPMLRRMYDLTEQCLDVPVMLSVAGAGGAALIQKSVTREDVMGNYAFKWLASTSNYNLQVRGQQLSGFFQTVMRVPPQMWQAAGVKLDLEMLVQTLWTDGFQLPDGHRLIQKADPVRSLDPELENELFEVGRGDDVTVSPADDDMAHMKAHDRLLGPGNDLDPNTQQLVMKHIQAHVAGMVAKHLMQQQQAMQQAPPQGPPRPGMPGGGMPGGPGNASGSGALAMPQAPGRIAQTDDMGDVQRQADRPMPGGMMG